MAVYTTIDDPEEYFVAKLYTGGNGSATTISGLSFQPDMVWCKGRSYTGVHGIMDDQRSGDNGFGFLRSESTDAENNTDGRGNISSFTSDGFVLSADSYQSFNYGTNTHVAWCWKESATAGFDIVGYEGTGSNTTFSHSLSAVPRFYMVKNRESGHNWGAYHQKIVDISGNAGQRLIPNLTNAGYNDASYFHIAPTSSVFSVGYNVGTNTDDEDHIAYLFTEKQGYSKFDMHTGNGNANGTFIYTGFRPAWVMIKQYSKAGEGWHIFDNKREGYNVDNDPLVANVNNAEGTSDMIDLLSNGFKLRTDSEAVNEDGETYVFMAFAESPFVNSKGVPNNAR